MIPTKIIRTIIIDDENYACDLLYELLRKYPEIHLQKVFTDPEKAIIYLQNKQVDLIFLDIKMPNLTGFDVIDRLNQLKIDTSIIFMTSHKEKAIEAIKKCAFDLILKPIDPIELQDSIYRFIAMSNQSNHKVKLGDLHNIIVHNNKIKFKSKNGLHLINPEDIIYVESEGNYSWLHIRNIKPILVTIQIGKIFSILKAYDFFRISRKNIISLNYLYQIDSKRKYCYLKINEKIIEFDVIKSRINDLMIMI